MRTPHDVRQDRPTRWPHISPETLQVPTSPETHPRPARGTLSAARAEAKASKASATASADVSLGDCVVDGRGHDSEVLAPLKHPLVARLCHDGVGIPLDGRYIGPLLHSEQLEGHGGRECLFHRPPRPHRSLPVHLKRAVHPFLPIPLLVRLPVADQRAFHPAHEHKGDDVVRPRADKVPREALEEGERALGPQHLFECVDGTIVVDPPAVSVHHLEGLVVEPRAHHVGWVVGPHCEEGRGERAHGIGEGARCEAEPCPLWVFEGTLFEHAIDRHVDRRAQDAPDRAHPSPRPQSRDALPPGDDAKGVDETFVLMALVPYRVRVQARGLQAGLDNLYGVAYDGASCPRHASRGETLPDGGGGGVDLPVVELVEHRVEETDAEEVLGTLPNDGSRQALLQPSDALIVSRLVKTLPHVAEYFVLGLTPRRRLTLELHPDLRYVEGVGKHRGAGWTHPRNHHPLQSSFSATLGSRGGSCRTQSLERAGMCPSSSR
mmetsp:Transcript_20765/g.50124  ORF Transcript_20765/g.50124 Transcript_20765/m.50124 type:complete len:492 (-) Transcript_20765:226-1701(-)